MNILKYKYKLHKLVNTLFYVLVFGIGFFTGFLSDKIDFNKVISQFLMIDNVKAYTFYDNNNIKIDEDFIYNGFKSKFSDFDMENYSHVLCNFVYKTGTTIPNNFYCLATTESSNYYTSLNSNLTDSSSNYVLLIHTPSYYINWTYDTNSNKFILDSSLIYNTGFNFYAFFNSERVISRTNFDISLSSDSHNDLFNTLNFDKYIFKNIYNITGIPQQNDYTLEDFILNKFNSDFSDFDYNTYKNIWCSITTSTLLQCLAMTDQTYTNCNFSVNGSNINVNTGSNGDYLDYYYFKYGYDAFNNYSNTYNHYQYYTNGNQLWNTHFTSDDHFIASTYPSNLAFNYTFNDRVLLNFDKVFNLEYNENIFKDNSNFKQVCVDGGKSFAITPINGNYSDNGQYEDFIWFPYGLNEGLVKVQYDSSSEYANGNIIPYPQDNMKEHFYFSSREQIDSFYNTDLPSSLESAGYTDKYSYYGYDAYKFFIVYKDGLFRYPIFTLENPSKTHISSNGNIHGGGGLRLDGDEEIELSNNYCFYIKKDYNVSIVNVNEWGDYNGTVTSPDGDYDFNTSYNEFNTNTDSFLSQPINFINSIRDTINFINSLIYEFYISLPLLLRTFIITILILLIIMLIMTIGGYK